jgi:mono/diheme cytochrome c family protein
MALLRSRTGPALGFGLMLLIAGAAFGQAPFTPRDEAPEELPAGAGRDETFYACTACHGFRLVAQQAMNRRQWSDSLDWMTEKHGMPKLEGDERKLILDYLETAYPPRAPGRGGSPNPFLPH